MSAKTLSRILVATYFVIGAAAVVLSVAFANSIWGH